MKDTVREIEEQLEALGPEEQRSVERVDLLNELAWEVGFLDPARSHEAATEAAEIADELSYPLRPGLGENEPSVPSLLRCGV